MALRWDFKAKSGTITTAKDGTKNWYEGNALMIVLNEWKEEETDYYSLAWFFLDKDHAKNCFGLNPKEGYKSNMFTEEDNPFTELVIYRKNCQRWKDLLSVVQKAFPDCRIILD